MGLLGPIRTCIISAHRPPVHRGPNDPRGLITQRVQYGIRAETTHIWQGFWDLRHSGNTPPQPPLNEHPTYQNWAS